MAVLDTSFFVTTVDVRDPLHSVAISWLEREGNDGKSLSAPWILAAEVGAAISRGLGDPALARKVVARLVNGDEVHLIPVDARLAARAAAIAIDHRIRGCDAIYVALAEALGEPLVTFDEQQSARAAGVVPVLRPGPGA